MTDDYRDLFDRAPFGYLTTTSAGVITQVNDTLLSWLGRDRDAVAGAAFSSLLSAGSRLFWETRGQSVLLLRGEAAEVALALTRADGSELSVVASSSLMPDGAGARIALLESTERQEYERSLLAANREAEASGLRVQVLQSSAAALIGQTTAREVADTLVDSATAAFDASSVTVYLIDDHGELVSAGGVERPPNAGGPVRLAVKTLSPVVVSNLEEAEARYPQFIGAMRSARVEAFTVVPLVVDGPPLGALLCTFSRGRPIDAAMIELQQALALQAAQALARVRLLAVLERQASHDALTGLANRQLLHDRLEESLAEVTRTGRPLAVVFFDLDGFKQVNDVDGHVVGDAALVEAAARLGSAVRSDDFCARFGGDEFVVLCPDADADGAAVIAERIRAAFAEPFSATPRPVSASIGVALVGASSTPRADLVLETADAAMYRSKQGGGDRATLETI